MEAAPRPSTVAKDDIPEARIVDLTRVAVLDEDSGLPSRDYPWQTVDDAAAHPTCCRRRFRRHRKRVSSRKN